MKLNTLPVEGICDIINVSTGLKFEFNLSIRNVVNILFKNHHGHSQVFQVSR